MNMKSKKEILDCFGELLVQEVFDNQYRFILNKVEDLKHTDGYKNLFHSMDEIQKKEIENYTKEILKGSLFDFLKIFEENEEFKLIYSENDTNIDLNQISEMLKSEPIIENGWIDRFSEKLDDSTI